MPAHSLDGNHKVENRAVQLMNWYWAEARRSWDASDRYAFCVWTAAALESALIAACVVKQAEIRGLKRPNQGDKEANWPKKGPEGWSLEDLIDAARVMGWAGLWENWPTSPPNVHADLARMLHTLRDIRNWLHPGLIIRRGFDWPSVVSDVQMAVLGAFSALMGQIRPIIEPIVNEERNPPVFAEQLHLPGIRVQWWESAAIGTTP